MFNSIQSEFNSSILSLGSSALPRYDRPNGAGPRAARRDPWPPLRATDRVAARPFRALRDARRARLAA